MRLAMFWKSSLYTLRKSRHILRDRIKWYEKHKDSLEARQRTRLEQLFADLDAAGLRKDRQTSDRLARELESLEFAKPKRSFLWYAGEFVVAIAVALVVATCIRMMWFEPFKIPTGSMRPTFEELDHLLVTKTSFGINIPLANRHILFDPTLVNRGEVVIWSGANVDLPDTDTVYFGLFPGKKRFIKREMGLPGDSLYFYGGRIYGVDREGRDVSAELSGPGMERLEHIPFNTFEGRISVTRPDRALPIYDVVLKQFNQPAGRFKASSYLSSDGQVFNGKEWVKDNPQAALKEHDTIETYTDFLGMRNFAMGRLLDRQEVKAYTPVDVSTLDDAVLYLELRHTPNLTNPKPRVGDAVYGQLRLALTPFVTVIPLQEEHLKVLMDNMYTSRFVVQNEFAAPWQIEGTRLNTASPPAPGIPDGTYEFYYGKAYSVGFGGLLTELPKTHPLYKASPQNVQFLYNLGIELNTAFSPYSPDQLGFPSRYVYFREGDLYTLGGLLLAKDSPVLEKFNADELARQEKASPSRPYIAFRDHGPPMKDGVIDVEFIRAMGITVPENSYVVLGDNHARSADSRTFGFIHENNLEGTPTAIIWPFGARWGLPEYSQDAWFNLPRMIIWAIAALCFGIWWYREHRLMTTSLWKRS
jgi:signal peptidase I